MSKNLDLHCVLCKSTNVEIIKAERNLISHRKDEYGDLVEVVIGKVDVLVIACHACGYENDITPRRNIVFQSP